MRVTEKKRCYQRALDLGLVGAVVTLKDDDGAEAKVVLHGFRTDHDHGGAFEVVVSPAETSSSPYGDMICALVHVSRVVELNPTD